MDVLQCPYCELRFRSESELQQHIAFDHPKEKEESDTAG
ncbi:MAG: C2H2-type zinc finger protein [Actinomycetota bacterium]